MPPNEIVIQQTAPLAKPDSFTESLVQVALEKGLNPTELYAILREERAMKAKMGFNAALAAFQSECPSIRKTSDVPAYVSKAGNRGGGYKYADLNDIIQTIRPILEKHGLSYKWSPTSNDQGMIGVRCTIKHIGGYEDIGDAFFLPTETSAGMGPQQKYGAASTFAQRYTLVMALGLIGCDPDTDCAPEVAPGAYITEEQKTELVGRCDETQSNVPKLFQWAGCTSFDDFPAAKFASAIAMLKAKPMKAKQ